MRAIINYKFNEDVYLCYSSNDDSIYMLYNTASPTMAKTLVVSDVETVFLYVPSQKGFILVASIHTGLFFDHLLYKVKEITYHPVLKTAKIFLGLQR